VNPATSDGRVSFELRVGVTGHREVDDGSRVEQEIGDALDRIQLAVGAPPTTEIVLVAVSALAEGADRLVANAILDRGGRLEVALPMSAAAYERDFKTKKSRDEFRELCSRATTVIENARVDSRDQGYERSGKYVVERADALIAIWDGESSRGAGGTAAIVEHARTRGRRMHWIHVHPAMGKTTVEGEIANEEFTSFWRYNDEEVTPAQLATAVSYQRGQFAAAASGHEASLGLVQLEDWVLPYFARADVLAARLQRRYARANVSIYALAAGATLVGALHRVRPDWLTFLVSLEMAILLVVAAFVVVGRKTRLHNRWLSYRFLAERFRSALFLALSGLGDRQEGGFDRVLSESADDAWVRRAFASVWNVRPQMKPHPPRRLPELRAFLAGAWIASQATYHRDAAARAHRISHRFERLPLALFVVSFLLVGLQLVDKGDETGFRRFIAVASLTLPAIAAALNGIAEQREFQRHGDRYERMAQYLERARDDMYNAPDLQAVQALAIDAETIMGQETQDWFGVMRFHDFKLA